MSKSVFVGSMNYGVTPELVCNVIENNAFKPQFCIKFSCNKLHFHIFDESSVLQLLFHSRAFIQYQILTDPNSTDIAIINNFLYYKMKNAF